jgi:hypothetical protein
VAGRTTRTITSLAVLRACMFNIQAFNTVSEVGPSPSSSHICFSAGKCLAVPAAPLPGNVYQNIFAGNFLTLHRIIYLLFTKAFFKSRLSCAYVDLHSHRKLVFFDFAARKRNILSRPDMFDAHGQMLKDLIVLPLLLVPMSRNYLASYMILRN